jgi:ubiquinol-cytochrome c reductase cytochrome c subunit
MAVLAIVAAGCGGGGGDEDGAGAEVKDTAVAKLDPTLAAHLPPGTTMEMAENGRKLFITCSVCHGLDAGGTQLGPSLRDDEWVDIDGSPEQIQQVIRDGVQEPKKLSTPMPPLGGGRFDAEQVRDLAAYVYAISHSASAPSSSAPDSARADSAAARP